MANLFLKIALIVELDFLKSESFPIQFCDLKKLYVKILIF